MTTAFQLFLSLFLTCIASPTISADDLSDHQKLNNELLQRWEQTKLPTFLEEKKGVIDEVMWSGLSIEPVVLREILDSDLSTHFKKNSYIVKQYQPDATLLTETPYQYLVQNLQKGQLEPRASEKHYSRYGIYLELRATPLTFIWSDVALHFSEEILDREDYHITPSWSYGNYIPTSASPSVNMGRTNYFFMKLLSRPLKNEIVFHNPISLKHLKQIVVKPGKKIDLIKELEQKNIPCPTANGWNNLVIERP